jgi:hypothetical protein
MSYVVAYSISQPQPCRVCGLFEQLKLLMACFNSATEWKIPRLRRRRVSLAKDLPVRDGHRELRICDGGTEQFF